MQNIKALKGAVAECVDPKTVVLMEGYRPGSTAKRQKLHHVPLLSTLHDFLLSHHSETCTILWSTSIDQSPEILKFLGPSATRVALQHHFRRDITPNVKSLKDAVAHGQNPELVAMMENVRDGKPGKGKSHSDQLLHMTRFQFVNTHITY